MAKKLKITILGAGGTIGRILAADLSTMHEVYPATRGDCDLRDRNSLNAFLAGRKDHVIVNCAMVGGKQELGSYDPAQLHDNLLAFHNLSDMRDRYRLMINIGSGAEFDVSRAIRMAKERELMQVLPRDSYGMAKNLIARSVVMQHNAINLRIFGCFDHREPSFRLMRRFVDSFQSGRQFVLAKDREMSWISGIDLGRIVAEIACGWPDVPQDINCSYVEPIRCMDLISTWCWLHSVSPAVRVEEVSDHSYTCDASSLHGLINKGLLLGPEESLRRYE